METLNYDHCILRPWLMRGSFSLDLLIEFEYHCSILIQKYNLYTIIILFLINYYAFITFF
jgi:hypothetical protein